MRSWSTESKNLFDVQVQDPVLLLATRPTHRDRIQRRTPRSITVGIFMEDRLGSGLDSHCHHGVGDSVGHGRHAQRARAPTRLWYVHRLDRGRKVRSRGHPVPDLVQIVLQILLEALAAPPPPPRAPFLARPPPIRLPNQLLR